MDPLVSSQIRLPPAQPTVRLTQALEDFERSLTAVQKKQFGRNCVRPNASSVLTFVVQIDRANSGQARRCFAPRLCSFLESVEQFVSVVDTFVNSQPTISALIWGVVKTTILTASNVASYFEKVTSMIMVIGKSCPTSQEFSLLYPNSINLQAALCEYYAIVIRLCTKVIEVSQRNNMLQIFSSVVQPFEAEFKPFRDGLEEAAATIQIHITLASNQAAREDQRLLELERTSNASLRRPVSSFRKKSSEDQAKTQEWRIAKARRQDSQMRSDIMMNLTVINHTRFWKQATRQRLLGTAEWFKQDPAFLDWRSAQRSTVLWCSGNLGTGKTVLAANVVAHLSTHQKPNEIVAYYFCRAEILESCQARQILGSIAAQMLESQVKMLDDADLTKTFQESQNLDTTDLMDFLCSRLLQDVTYYVLLDGLDECKMDEVHMIASGINTLRASRAVGLKIMCLGRPQLRRQLFNDENPTHMMSLSRENVKSDIQKYIKETLEERLEQNRIRLGNPRLVLEVISALEDDSNGMILWARLLIEELCYQKTDHQILQALHELPRSLLNLFDRKLEQLKATRHAEHAIKILQFVGVAKRPLTIDEIREALTIEIGQKSLDLSSLPIDISKIISDCCGLVYIDEEDSSVHYIHHSLYQYLFQSTPFAPALFDKTALDKHVGLLCLTYINFTDFSLQLVKTPKASNVKIEPWKIGATAVAGLPEIGNGLALRLLRSSSLRRRDVTARNLERKTRDLLGVDDNARLQSDLKLSRFQFLSYVQKYWIFHLTRLTKNDGRELWQVFGKCVDGTISMVDRPWESLGPAIQPNLMRDGHVSDDIQWLVSALKGSSRSYVRWLVDNQHNSLFSWTILENLSAFTNEEMESLFLGFSRLANVYMMNALVGRVQLTTDQLSEALVTSAKNGSADALEILLVAKASTESIWNGRTALQAAAEGGHIEVVERLLAAMADVNAAAGGHNGRTALQAAAEGGHIEVVERLLAAKADVNAAAGGHDGRAALLWAAANGHMTIVKLLLEKGADLESKDSFDQTALSWAAASGHEAVVKLLLEKGAKLEPKDSFSQTALSWAAASGHETVVKLLLENGAELESKDNSGQTALSWAAANGHETVVKQLLEDGAELQSTDIDGRTPLLWAAENGHEAVVKLLLEKGADLDTEGGHNNLTALECATANKHEAVVRLLQRASEKMGWLSVPNKATRSLEMISTILSDMKEEELESTEIAGSNHPEGYGVLGGTVEDDGSDFGDAKLERTRKPKVEEALSPAARIGLSMQRTMTGPSLTENKPKPLWIPVREEDLQVANNDDLGALLIHDVHSSLLDEKPSKDVDELSGRRRGREVEEKASGTYVAEIKDRRKKEHAVQKAATSEGAIFSEAIFHENESLAEDLMDRSKHAAEHSNHEAATTDPQEIADMGGFMWSLLQRRPRQHNSRFTLHHPSPDHRYSLIGKCKRNIEARLQSEVLWWPLSTEPARCHQGMIRLKWDCTCGASLNVIISSVHAELFCQEVGFTVRPGQQPPLLPTHRAQPSGSSLIGARSTHLGTGTSVPPIPIGNIQGQSNGNSQTRNRRPPGPTLSQGQQLGNYLHWCVEDQAASTRLVELETQPLTEESLVPTLLAKYKAITGMRTWFTFKACAGVKFVKFRKFSLRSDLVASLKDELPSRPHPEYEYEYVNPGIPQEEFIGWLQAVVAARIANPSCPETVALCSILVHMPKKVNGRMTSFDGYGLQAMSAYCLWKAVFALFIASVPSAIFMIRWLIGHKGDWQNAIALLAITYSLLNILILQHDRWLTERAKL